MMDVILTMMDSCMYCLHKRWVLYTENDDSQVLNQATVGHYMETFSGKWVSTQALATTQVSESSVRNDDF